MSAACVPLKTPVDDLRLAALHSLSETAARLQVPLLVMGAFARDLWFEHVYEIPAPRATLDVDMAIHVDDWAQFQRLRENLADRDGWESRPDHIERFRFRGIPVDVIPFGGVARADGSIRWPGDGSTMSVIGFAEAYRASVLMELGAPKRSCRLQVATIPALAVLKLVAWHDRPDQRGKDVGDMAFVIQNYLAAGQRERLITGPQAGLVREHGRDDPVLAAARLLGWDMAQMLTPTSAAIVRAILAPELASSSRCPFTHRLRRDFHGSFRRAREVVASLMDGFAAGEDRSAHSRLSSGA